MFWLLGLISNNLCAILPEPDLPGFTQQFLIDYQLISRLNPSENSPSLNAKIILALKTAQNDAEAFAQAKSQFITTLRKDCKFLLEICESKVRVKNFYETFERNELQADEVLRLDPHKGSLVSKRKFFESFSKKLNASDKEKGVTKGNQNERGETKKNQPLSPLSEKNLKKNANLHLRLKKEDLLTPKCIKKEKINCGLLRALLDSFCNSKLKVVELSTLWNDIMRILKSEQLNEVITEKGKITGKREGLIMQIVELISILVGSEVSPDFIEVKIRKYFLIHFQKICKIITF